MKTINLIKKQQFKKGGNIQKFLTGGSSDGIYVEMPDYNVGVSESGNKKVTLPLGHGMVIAVDENTGSTRGSEYGRYDKANKGLAHRVTVPNFRPASPGNPTDEELNQYAKKVNDYYNKYSGHNTGGTVKLHYVKGADEDEMIKLMKSAETNDRKNGFYTNTPYRILDHNCGTYGADIIKKSMPWNKFSGFGPYSWGRPAGVAPYWGGTGKFSSK